MKRLKKILFKAVILSICCIAVSTAYAQKPFTIKGNLGKDKQGKIRITYRNGNKPVADSTQVKDGIFVLKGIIGDPNEASIVLNPSNVNPWQLTQEGMKDDQQRFFLESGTTIIKGDEGLKTASVTGDKTQAGYARLMAAYKPLNEQNRVLQEMAQKYKAEMNDTGLVRIQGLAKVFSQKKKDIDSTFMADNPDSYLAFIMCFKNEIKGASIDPKVTEPKFSHFTKDVYNSEAGKKLSARIAVAKKIDIGMTAPDFTLNDTLGHAVSLSSLKGKYILVWFWQSMVMGIEQDIFNVNKVYKKFKGRNLTVLGVSYDRQAKMSDDKKYEPEVRANWKKVIRENNMGWLNVIDYGGIIIKENKPVSPVAKAYDLNYYNIPQCLLIGPDGKILLRAYASDKDLASKIEKLIKK
jgi:hypothetical protein